MNTTPKKSSIYSNISINKILGAISSFLIGPTISDIFITSLVTNAARDVLTDYLRKKLIPTQVNDITDRAKVAAERIEEASSIINELQAELQTRSTKLNELMEEVAKRQSEATHWATLASVNEELASAFTEEMEKRVRQQVRAELDRGKRRRQIVGVIIWIFTLLAGAFAGAIAQQWWQTGSFAGFVTPTLLP